MKHSFSVLSQICQRTTRRQSFTKNLKKVDTTLSHLSHMSQNRHPSPKSPKSHKTQKFFFKKCPTHSWELSMYCTAGAVFKSFFSKTVPHHFRFQPKNLIFLVQNSKIIKYFFSKSVPHNPHLLFKLYTSCSCCLISLRFQYQTNLLLIVLNCLKNEAIQYS